MIDVDYVKWFVKNIGHFPYSIREWQVEYNKGDDKSGQREMPNMRAKQGQAHL